MSFILQAIRENRSESMRNPSETLVRAMGGAPTSSGVQVNEPRSLGLTAVWACIRLLAWTQASLPMVLYRDKKPRGKEKAKEDRMYDILRYRPNPEQTTFDWVEHMSRMQNLYGAGVSEIEFDGRGRPVAFWPIHTDRVRPKRVAVAGESRKVLVYEIYDDAGQSRILREYQVLIWRSLGSGSDQFLSPIQVHRETLGESIAIREYGAKTFGEGTNPSAILSGLRFQQDDNEESVRKKFSDKYSGLSNANRLMLLEDGVSFNRVGIPPADAQYIEARKYGTSEVARIYNVPLNLLQDHEKTTTWGTGLEEMNSAFITFSLRPYLVRAEQELRRKVLFDRSLYIEFMVDSLLRGKLLERYRAYAIARQWGFMSANDVREKENANPLPDDSGDIYLIPMNMDDAEHINDADNTASDQNTGGS